MEQASEVSFYIHLMLPTKNGTRSMMVKINPGAQVNTIPLSRYQKLFPHKISDSRYPKSNALNPTSQSWISHDGKPQPFLRHFIAEVNHATEPRSYPTHFYVFVDATCLQILLSYAMSECLGILEFKVPNLVTQLHIDALTVPTSPNLGGLRKTAKCITFWDHLIDLDEPHHTSPPCGRSPIGLRKNVKMKIVQFKDPINSVINGTSCRGPSLSTTKLLIPALKACKPSLPTTKPNSALKPIKPKVTLTFPSTAAAQDIVTLKQAFLSSFDTIGNMSVMYTSRTQPSIFPIQHA